MSCCSAKNPTVLSDSDAVKAVNEAYSARALKAGEDTERESIRRAFLVTPMPTLSGLGSKTIATGFGYTSEELNSIPAESNMGLSCGNPTALAKLKEVRSAHS
jgi:arsenite methyltransferase